MAKPIHSMIRALEEGRSVDFYRRAFGLEPADRLDFGGFTLVYLRSPDLAGQDRTAALAVCGSSLDTCRR